MEEKHLVNNGKRRFWCLDPTNIQTIVMIILFLIGICVAKKEYRYQKMYEYKKLSYENIIGLLYDINIETRHEIIKLEKNEESVILNVYKSLRELLKATKVGKNYLCNEAVDELKNYTDIFRKNKDKLGDGVLDWKQFYVLLNTDSNDLMDKIHRIQKSDLGIK
ncbi:MAG: hypothetical protein P9X24_14545 [Candidatus Hatepunaea meridiana]|nr:hypothetical protein [Candidatus Hatepunaea meridiana]